ncbi:hypothetical protein J2S97_003885 [Arthrobacter oryzae]|nr:hypothetical protein [Arthrobacter oryzae]
MRSVGLSLGPMDSRALGPKGAFEQTLGRGAP